MSTDFFALSDRSPTVFLVLPRIVELGEHRGNVQPNGVNYGI